MRVEHTGRGRPVWEKAGPRLEALLAESPKWTGGKQWLTATRLHTMLVTEGLTMGITTVKDAVAEWKRRRREVFVPLLARTSPKCRGMAGGSRSTQERRRQRRSSDVNG